MEQRAGEIGGYRAAGQAPGRMTDMDMRTYVTRKVIYMVITLFAIIAFNFFLFRIMPGDPAAVLVPKSGSEVLKDAIRDKFHLNDPIYVQLYYYFIQVFTGDLGISTGVWKNSNIADAIGPKIFNTVG